jgi:hypothetical protein
MEVAPMGNNFFDFFQLMLAVYLFYAAFNKNGSLYEFPGVPEAIVADMKPKLKIMFLCAGSVALLDSGISFLKNRMFTVVNVEGVETITQNFRIDWLPFLSYRLLNTVSTVLLVLLMGFFVFLFIWIRKRTK